MPIASDFTVYPATKVIRHVANTNVYAVSAFYSWLMDVFDEPGYMTYPTPMKYSTPTSYTMLNNWFLDNGDESNALQYLTGGSILTTGYGTTTPGSDPIRMIELDSGASNYVDCIASDKDLPVTDDATTVGPLLAYKNVYPSSNLGRWWIRDTRATPAAIADNSVMLVTNANPVNYCQNLNANTAVWTDETADINNATANDVLFPPQQITTVGDVTYFGDTVKFGRMRINVGTAKSVTGGVYAWEYWNGAWVAIPGIVDNTTFFGTAGTNNVTFTPPADWVTNAVNVITKYWIRAVVTTLPSAITTAPLGTQGWRETGSGDAVGADDCGDEIYTNIYTIASFPGTPNPQVYIFQNHPVSGTSVRIAEWSAFANWDRGSIDVLISVQLGGDLVNAGIVDVFVRQPGDSFTYVSADLSSGARTPVATETAKDEVNITKGEHYLFFDGGTSPAFATGDVIQDVATNSGTVPSWYAEVVSHVDWDTATGYLVLRGVRGTIPDNANIFVGVSDTTADVNGTPGDTYGTWGSEVAGPIAGDIGKILLGGTTLSRRILRGFQDDGTTGKYVCDANHAAGVIGNDRKPYYRAYNATEALSCTGDGGTMNVVSNLISVTLISGYSDITIGHINGTVAVGTFSGVFIIGEKVTWDAGASSGILVKTDGSTSMTLANVTSPDTLNTKTITGQSSAKTCVASGNLVDANTATFAFLQQTAYTYTTFVEGGSIYEAGRSLPDIYALPTIQV